MVDLLLFNRRLQTISSEDNEDLIRNSGYQIKRGAKEENYDSFSITTQSVLQKTCFQVVMLVITRPGHVEWGQHTCQAARLKILEIQYF